MLKQRLQQQMVQKLSPQQVLLMKLLQIPSLALEERIKQEIEENPVLELQTDSSSDESSTPDEYGEGEPSAEENENRNDVDIRDYMDYEDDTPSYRLNAQNNSADYEHHQIPYVSDTSFQESLISQLQLRNLTERENTIAYNIIGNIDESGYLQRDLNAMVDDLAFQQNFVTHPSEVEKVLAVIQSLEPAGVGARNLQECLLLQLERQEETEAVLLAKLVLKRCYDDFIKKHYKKIQKRLHCDKENLSTAIDQILKLNPKPGSAVTNAIEAGHFIVPDFEIQTKNGEIELFLNQRNMPELRLSKTYLEMLNSYIENKKNNNNREKETIQFIKQKVDSAKWFIDAIKQRQSMLLLTMNAIIDYQYEYFLTGDESKLRPMILKDIAERVNFDISTISRVANSKYVQTPFGTFLLKSFFSEAMQNEDGEEVSTREIKKILSDCVKAETKDEPLTDEELTLILKEKGYPIARRTVAKYRQQLNIPVARLRKEV